MSEKLNKAVDEGIDLLIAGLSDKRAKYQSGQISGEYLLGYSHAIDLATSVLATLSNVSNEIYAVSLITKGNSETVN